MSGEFLNVNMNKERIVFIDWLRVVAIVAVIVLHVADDYPSTIDPNCIEYQTLNFFNGIVRWGVPVFVMISGSLFLSMNYDMGGGKEIV